MPIPDGVRVSGMLRGHDGAIGDIVWSPDGSLLVSESQDGTVRIWDRASLRQIRKMSNYKNGVRTPTFNRNGQILAIGSEDGRIDLWKSGSWKRLKTLDLADTVGECISLAFSPLDDTLACAGRESAALIDISTGAARPLASREALTDLNLLQVAFDQAGSTVAVANADDAGVGLYDAADGRLLNRLVRGMGTTTSIAFAPGGNAFAGADVHGAIHIWNLRSGQLIRILEGHTGSISGLSFLSDGRLLASKGADGTVRLWDCAAWSPVCVIPEPGQGGWVPRLAFHPHQPLLAAVGSDQGKPDDAVVHLWQLDPDYLLTHNRPPSVTYASAKIVLVGESGVGKTGLGYRLSHGKFREHPSTHGQQFWLLDGLGTTRADGAQCEAVLWDLAGQPDYRLIHALFLADADLALVLFDPTRHDDPLRDVDYWLRQLGTQEDNRDGPGGKRGMILVAARVDRGGARLTVDEIERFCAERGIQSYVMTSAATGDGLAELLARMREAVDWDSRPSTVTTDTFKWIKDLVLGLKESQATARVIVSPAELRDLLARADPDRQFDGAEMLAAVGHLVTHGYLAMLRTSHGEARILLAPELVNNIAASIVLEARRNLKGLGSLEEKGVLNGDYRFPELNGLDDDERDTLLDSAVGMFLENHVGFRETDPLSSRVFLVFPELINLARPAGKNPEPVSDGIAYTVTGAVENVYASLVVLLGYTDVFTRTSQWRNQAEYVVGDSLICGFRLEDEREGELDFVLYFGASVGDPIRMLFQSLFESFLSRRDLMVRRFESVTCSEGHQLNRAVLREQLAEGNEAAFCARCGEQLSLPRADVPIQLTRHQSADLDAQRRTAAQRSLFERALFQLSSSLPPKATAPVCFISYAWGNRDHERWVARELAADLSKAGITVLLDRWENTHIGASVARFIQRIASADHIVVVGTPLYQVKYDNNEPMGGFVTAAEGDLIDQRLTSTESRKETVQPILLEGDMNTSLPPLLRGRVYADFRERDRYFLAAFDLILSVRGIPANDPACTELRDSIEKSMG
jgi:small GTP-binding protein